MAVAMERHETCNVSQPGAQSGPFATCSPESLLATRPASPDGFTIVTLGQPDVETYRAAAKRFEDEVADIIAVSSREYPGLFPIAPRGTGKASRFGISLIPIDGGSPAAAALSSPRRMRRLERLSGGVGSLERPCSGGADSPRPGLVPRLTLSPAAVMPAVGEVAEEAAEEDEVEVEEEEEEEEEEDEEEVEEMEVLEEKARSQQPWAGPCVPLYARYHTSVPPPMPSARLLIAASSRRDKPAAEAQQQEHEQAEEQEQEQEQEQAEEEAHDEVEDVEAQPQLPWAGPCVPMYARYHTSAPPPQPTALLALLRARRVQRFTQLLRQWGLVVVA